MPVPAPASPLDSQVVQRMDLVQTPALPTGQAGGAEDGCLSKCLLSPLDSQVGGTSMNRGNPVLVVKSLSRV